VRGHVDRQTAVGIAIVSVLVLVALPGCNDREELMLRQMEELKREMAQLKATSANTAVVLDDLQNKMLLLEDQVDSARTLAQRAGGPPMPLPVVKVSPRSEEAPPRKTPGTEPPVVVLQQLDAEGRIIGEDGTVAEEAVPAPEPAERKRSSFDSRPVVLYNQSFELLRSKQHADAIEGFERFLDQYPNHDYSDNAMYWMGEAYYDIQNYEKAQECFDKVIALYQDGNKVPDAMLKSALCQYNSGNKGQAREMMDRLVTAYPLTGAAGIAKKKIAELQ